MNIKQTVLGFTEDSRGRLTVIPINKIPFRIRNMFYVTKAGYKTVRGGHGHYKCKQVLICLKGIIEVTCKHKKETRMVTMKAGDKLYIPSGIWSSQRYCTGSDVLLVLASHPYDKKDYFY